MPTSVPSDLTLRTENQGDPERIHLVFQLKRLLQEAPFIPTGEKEQMEKTIVYFGNDILRALIASMIREGLRVLNDRRYAQTR